MKILIDLKKAIYKYLEPISLDTLKNKQNVEPRILIRLFLDSVLLGFLVVLYFLIVFWGSKDIQGLCIIVSFAVVLIYFYLAHKFVECLITGLWKYAILDRIPNKLTACLGNLDRVIYALCFAYQQYTLVGVWLGVKIASRLVQFKGVEITSDDEVDNEKIKKLGERKNIFLIGNITSLVLSVGAGYLIIVLFNLPLPNFWK